MKLLLDQNLSRKLVIQIENIFPDSNHVTSVLSETVDDRTIWEFAKQNNFMIVTKDDDFEQRSILFGHPPKVIWIRLGNCRTADVERLLRNSQKVIEAFGEDDQKSILPLP
jgi:predicted nuclease of predicted toxin-antitoxin system